MIFEEETKQEFVLPQLEDAQIDGKVTIKLSSEIVKPTHTQLLQGLAEFNANQAGLRSLQEKETTSSSNLMETKDNDDLEQI